MTSITTEVGSNGYTGALFEGLYVPADVEAALARSTPKGAPRVQSAVRNQIELRACDLDSSLPAEHQARAVWAFVQSIDLQALYAQIRAVEGSVGRAPIDPAILVSLWLYATLDGVGSARELDRLCDSDDAYRWLCGEVGVNHHTLGDFRVGRWGFAKHDHIDQLEARATKVFAPVVAPRDEQRDRYAPLPGDSHALGQWRERMGTDAAKLIYKERAASIECTNAHLRNRGLQRFNVRGLNKARAVLLWHALAHNLKRMMALNFAFPA